MTISVARGLLRLKPDFTREELRKAYRRAMKECHPDAVVDSSKKALAEEKSKRINLAYEMLSNYGYKDEITEKIKKFYVHCKESKLKQEIEKIALFAFGYMNGISSKNELNDMYNDFTKLVTEQYKKYKSRYFRKNNIPDSFNYSFNYDCDCDTFISQFADVSLAYLSHIKEEFKNSLLSKYSNFNIGEEKIEKMASIISSYYGTIENYFNSGYNFDNNDLLEKLSKEAEVKVKDVLIDDELYNQIYQSLIKNSTIALAALDYAKDTRKIEQILSIIRSSLNIMDMNRTSKSMEYDEIYSFMTINFNDEEEVEGLAKHSLLSGVNKAREEIRKTKEEQAAYQELIDYFNRESKKLVEKALIRKM